MESALEGTPGRVGRGAACWPPWPSSRPSGPWHSALCSRTRASPTNPPLRPPRALPTSTGSVVTRRLGLVAAALWVAWLVLALVLSPADRVQGRSGAPLLPAHCTVLVAFLAFGVTALGGCPCGKVPVLGPHCGGVGGDRCVLRRPPSSPCCGGDRRGASPWCGTRGTTSRSCSCSSWGTSPFAASRAIRPLGPSGRPSPVWGLHRRPARSLLSLLVADPPGTDNHRLDPQIDGLMLFTFVVGLAAVALWYVWLVIHRFRVAYLEEQLDEQLFHRPARAARPGRPGRRRPWAPSRPWLRGDRLPDRARSRSWPTPPGCSPEAAG